jgi:ribosomal protein L4
VAWRRSHLPEYPEENFTQKVNRKMYRAGLAAILSQLAREDRLVGDRRLRRRSAEDQAVRAES